MKPIRIIIKMANGKTRTINANYWNLKTIKSDIVAVYSNSTGKQLFF